MTRRGATINMEVIPATAAMIAAVLVFQELSRES
jgi:hypothetical protein